MKQLASLLLALICAVTLTTSAFAAQPDAFSLYQNYVIKSKSIKSTEYSAVQKLALVGEDANTELAKINSTVTTVLTKQNNIQIEIKMKNPDTKKTDYIYFKDGYLYQKSDYGNYKTKIGSKDNFSLSAGIMPNLTKEDLKNAKVEKVDGGTKIIFQTKQDDITGPFDYLMDAVRYNNTKTKFSNITTGIVFSDDGMLKSLTNVYEVTMTEENRIAFKFRVTQTSKVKSINTVKEIKFPNDLNSYKAV